LTGSAGGISLSITHITLIAHKIKPDRLLKRPRSQGCAVQILFGQSAHLLLNSDMVYVGYFFRSSMEGQFSCSSPARATHPAAIGPIRGLNYSIFGELELNLHGVTAFATKKCTGIRRVNGAPLWINPALDTDPGGKH
jgi:hypothetical protein